MLDPTIARVGGDIFRAVLAPSSLWGESLLIPWTGPLSHHLFLTGAQLENVWGQMPGQVILKKDALLWAIQRGGAGKGAGGPPFLGPVGPVTNTT